MKRKALTTLLATTLLVGVPTVSFASGDTISSLKREVKSILPSTTVWWQAIKV
ncbi:hypothetical protein L1999_27545 [Neobacillus drentensis]|uniref:hypothetical protein n=1 Tax=Neobacillus drentensis TaxID=220684 RepID=UPI001F22DC19|nr:hypothetical protein [Neobacillus drentensis]ULT56743.1 hypothetical protein L1999_27545 [Neobacillus drentensis]